MPTESPEISEEEPQPKPRAKEEAPKRAVTVPEEEEAEEELPAERPVVRNRSNRPRAAPSEEPKKHHHKSPEGRSHHKHHEHRDHHGHRKHRDRRSERPVESPADEEAMLGNFGLDKKTEGKQAIASSSSEDDVPTYSFAAPISRISRSPTPVRRSTVIAPNRRFVPSSQKVQQIDEDEDLEITGTLSKLGNRSFASMTPTGAGAGARPATGTAAIRSTTP